MNLNLIGQIYESIGDSDSMADVVQSLVALTNSRCAQFGLLDRAGRWVQANEVGGDPVGLDLYVRHYAAEDPRLVYCLDHQGRLYNDKEITGDAETYERSALVNEILNKYDTRFGLCTVFPVAPNYSAGLAVMRAQRDGSYGNSEFKKLAILLPHFQRAMSLHVRLGRLESRLASIDALADRLSSPVLLVDRTGALQHANSSGQEALRGAEYLVLRNGRVRPRSLRQAQQFMDMLAAALSNEVTEPSASVRLFDIDGHAALLVVQALRGQVNLGGMPQADVVLFLIRGDARMGFRRRFDAHPADDLFRIGQEGENSGGRGRDLGLASHDQRFIH